MIKLNWVSITTLIALLIASFGVYLWIYSNNEAAGKTLLTLAVIAFMFTLMRFMPQR